MSHVVNELEDFYAARPAKTVIRPSFRRVADPGVDVVVANQAFEPSFVRHGLRIGEVSAHLQTPVILFFPSAYSINDGVLSVTESCRSFPGKRLGLFLSARIAPVPVVFGSGAPHGVQILFVVIEVRIPAEVVVAYSHVRESVGRPSGIGPVYAVLSGNRFVLKTSVQRVKYAVNLLKGGAGWRVRGIWIVNGTNDTCSESREAHYIICHGLHALNELGVPAIKRSIFASVVVQLILVGNILCALVEEVNFFVTRQLAVQLFEGYAFNGGVKSLLATSNHMLNTDGRIDVFTFSFLHYFFLVRQLPFPAPQIMILT